VRFFFDNCISSKLTEAMKLLNKPHHHIEHLTERFNADEDDEIWIPKVAAEGDLILISADPAITSSPKEKAVWRSSKLTAFFFASGFPEQEKWAQIIEVTRWWPEIVRTAQSAPRGAGYRLPLRGKQAIRLYDPPA
jgi:PIN domain-containing protein